MKPIRMAAFAACFLASVLAVRAEEKKMEAPKPGPEVQKLGYFVGTWNSSGEIKENPMMPAGKMTSVDKCEWFSGGFQVVCHSTGKMAMGTMHGLGIAAYNAGEKVYTYMIADSSGYSGMSKGTVDGDTWTYTSDEKMGDKVMHGRYTMVMSSPTSYTFKYEMSPDGTQWSTIMEGKTVKAGAMKKADAPAAKK